MNVTIKIKKPHNEMTDAELAAYIKHQGIERQAAYSAYVRLRGLSPRVNAKEFFRIYDDVTAAPWPETSKVVDFTATHHDTLTVADVMIVEMADGWEIIWENGYRGHNPPVYPPKYENYEGKQRFVPYGN